MIEGMTELRQVDSVQKLEKGAEQVRDEVTNVVRALARRRGDIVDWLMQLREERPAAGLAAIGAFLVAGGVALFFALRPQRSHRRSAQRRTSRPARHSRRR
jgi:hypothetical protein